MTAAYIFATGLEWIAQTIRIFSAPMESERTVPTMPKRINPRRRPATMADVQRTKDTAGAR